MFGAISLILAFFVLGSLPVNYAGVALVLLAFVLFTAEFYVGGIGALGVGGAVSIIAGGLLLTPTSNPDFQVSRWLVVPTGGASARSSLMFVATVIRTRRMPASLGTLAMVGNKAIARSDLEPEGYVFVEGERWKAIVEDGPIDLGEAVTDHRRQRADADGATARGSPATVGAERRAPLSIHGAADRPRRGGGGEDRGARTRVERAPDESLERRNGSPRDRRAAPRTRCSSRPAGTRR